MKSVSVLEGGPSNIRELTAPQAPSHFLLLHWATCKGKVWHLLYLKDIKWPPPKYYSLTMYRIDDENVGRVYVSLDSKPSDMVSLRVDFRNKYLSSYIYFLLNVSELLRVLWTARRSNQSVLKESNPEYPLEKLMLKLKLPYFGRFTEYAPDVGKDWG